MEIADPTDEIIALAAQRNANNKPGCMEGDVLLFNGEKETNLCVTIRRLFGLSDGYCLTANFTKVIRHSHYDSFLNQKPRKPMVSAALFL